MFTLEGVQHFTCRSSWAAFAGIFTLQMISPYCASKFKARREMPDQEYVTFMRSHFYFKLGDESGIGHVMW
jgi:hypothetical protein